MCSVPMKNENWKLLPVTLNVSLLTALLITGWMIIVDSDHALFFSGNLRGHIGSRRWHGLESIDRSMALSKRNGDEQMVQIPAGVEKLNVVAPNLQALLLIVSIITYITYQENSEKYCLLFSATKYEEFKKIILLLLLISQIPVTTACDPGEYENDGVCCSLCSPGSRVSKHCTLMTGTTCNPCTTGEYMEHPNGLEKCFKCKLCDPELGLQVKQPCTYTHNTICKPREGYYCIANCQMVRKHTVCPPGEGVKEKGTPFKDTVCEKCPHGTFSSKASTTEECKSWTVCETLKLKQVEAGDAEADVKCEAESNMKIAVPVVIIAVVVTLSGIVAGVLWKKCKCKSGNRNVRGTRNHNGDKVTTEPLNTSE
ncbi:tumor necrosis factor receptor superfamily member 5-like isoform X2 [Mobula birostris]|uniref:tumor necrosis factor receptor superfamily member 5-like isoform X2 n=1 Tax=Mobula birostris TaxID=1983395 RepID=UPI003B27CE24